MTTPNPSTALAQTLVDEFIRCGVTHACISPGSRSAPLALAVAARPEIEKHIVLDERSSAFYALGIAKRTGVPALLICTSGTAAANFLPAVHEANRAGVPMVILTADRPPELRQTGANQTTDQLKMFGDAVRWFVEVGAPEELPTSNLYWRSTVARAFLAASGAPRGPVHLNVALREPLVPVEDGPPFRFDLDGRGGGAPWHTESTPTHHLPRETIDVIRRAERGLIVAGHLESGGATVAEMAEGLGWPLIAEATSNARRRNLSVDHYDLVLENGSFANSHAPDLVLRFGSVGLSKNLARLLGPVRQILIDNSPTWLDAGRTAELRMRIEPAAFCEALSHDPVTTATPAEWSESWQQASGSARRVLDEELAQTPISEPMVARQLVRDCSAGSQLLVGASMPVRDVDNFSAARDGIRFFANRGLNGIDGFVSSAFGIAAGHDGPTFALCGDLTFLHDGNGFLDAARRKADITFVVVNNKGGGIFSFLPQADLPEHFETIFGTPQGVDLSRLCGAHGIDHQAVQDEAALEALVTRPDGVRVLEIATDRAENHALHSRLRERVRAALD